MAYFLGLFGLGVPVVRALPPATGGGGAVPWVDEGAVPWVDESSNPWAET